MFDNFALILGKSKVEVKNPSTVAKDYKDPVFDNVEISNRFIRLKIDLSFNFLISVIPNVKLSFWIEVIFSRTNHEKNV